MASTVWHWNLRASMKAPFDQKIKKILKQSKLNQNMSNKDMVGIKLHFGEQGTTGFMRPVWVRPFVDFIKKTGATPFLTDASTLYVGQRGNSPSHTMQAERHGFTTTVTGAPVVIADGIRGQYQAEVEINKKHFEKAYIAGDIDAADHLVFLSHVKGHGLAGYGGALKNIGMGCASKMGKMRQHVTTGPKLNVEHCVGCGLCATVCEAEALVLDPETEKMTLDMEKCVGCGSCFHVCKAKALEIDWKTNVQEFLERMMEYCWAVLKKKAHPSLCVNFIYAVSPDCDCHVYSDAPICPDLGILASYDPVALDQASLDLVNQAQPLYPSALPKGVKPGDNKFLKLKPDLPPNLGLDYAEEIGLGSRKYKLVKI